MQLLNFATTKITTVATLARMPAYGLSVSPDGRWLLYSEYEGRGGELMLVDNFR